MSLTSSLSSEGAEKPMRPATASMARPVALMILWLAFALLPELVLGSAKPFERGATGALVYALTALGSLFTWWWVAAGVASLRARSPKLGWAAVALVGPLGTLLTVGPIHYRWFFGTDVRPIAIAYFLENPRYAASLVEHSLSPSVRFALVGGALFGIVTSALVTARPFSPKTQPPRFTAWLAIAPLALVSIPFTGCEGYPCIAELRGERAIVRGIARRGWSEPLHALPIPHRVALAAATPTRAPDIVVIVGESLGAEQVAPWNGKELPSDGLLAKLRAHGGETVWFSDAVSVAPVTAISVPSILSGLAPDASAEDYEKAPLLWHEARVRGYRTAFFSAQDFHVDFFEGFYLSDGGPDESKNAVDHADLPRVNDRGIADARTVDDAIAFAEHAPRDRPILLVVQMNATHWPCWSPDLEGAVAIPERCAHAVGYVDRELSRLTDALTRTRDIDDVVVVGTSDHGESFDGSRPARSVNYYQGVLRVPLFVHLPKKICVGAPELCANLSKNQKKRAANLDVFPTILGIWQSPTREDSPASRPAIAGDSLIEPLPDDRTILAIAESAIWDPVADGLGVFDGRWKWVIDEFHGVRLFDLATDPGETKNLADVAPPEVVARLRLELARHPRAAEVCRHVAPSVLEGTWAPKSW